MTRRRPNRAARALITGRTHNIGLIVAGITGFCGMAKVLALMPWNRRPA